MAARVRTDGATIAAKLVLPRDAADRLRAVNTRRRFERHWPTVLHEPDPVRAREATSHRSGRAAPRARRSRPPRHGPPPTHRRWAHGLRRRGTAPTDHGPMQ